MSVEAWDTCWCGIAFGHKGIHRGIRAEVNRFYPKSSDGEAARAGREWVLAHVKVPGVTPPSIVDRLLADEPEDPEEPERFSCGDCDRTYPTPAALADHRRRIHSLTKDEGVVSEPEEEPERWSSDGFILDQEEAEVVMRVLGDRPVNGPEVSDLTDDDIVVAQLFRRLKGGLA